MLRACWNQVRQAGANVWLPVAPLQPVATYGRPSDGYGLGLAYDRATLHSTQFSFIFTTFRACARNGGKHSRTRRVISENKLSCQATGTCWLPIQRLSRYAINALLLLALAAVTFGHASHAMAEDNVSVAGLFPGKAVLIVNGSPPKTYSAGATIADGIRLVSVGESSATIDVHGRRQHISIGGQALHRAPAGQASSVVLTADGRGHFTASGQINGGVMSMMVDTGATLIALPARDALRLGIDYRKGQIGQVNTANGIATAYRVKLDTVRIGGIELHHVDALVQETGLNIGLLGMSFLNRTVMQRDGEKMTLTKRF